MTSTVRRAARSVRGRYAAARVGLNLGAARRRTAVRRWGERALFGGDRRERFLISVLSRHYESLKRRQWALADEPPHFFDHRIGIFAVAAGSWHPYSYYRGFFAAEVIRGGDVLLDIGCGDGFFARRFFSPKCSLVDAIDIEPSAIEHAVRLNAAPNIEYVVADAVADPFPQTEYDVIVFDGALGHFPPESTARLLEKIRDALAADGIFVGSESLGEEGYDHLQFFAGLDDLRALFSTYFDHVQLRTIAYKIPTGALRHEAFWRCANARARLEAVAWLE